MSVSVTVPVREPVAEGLKVTLMVHPAFAATEGLQLSDSVKFVLA